MCKDIFDINRTKIDTIDLYQFCNLKSYSNFDFSSFFTESESLTLNFRCKKFMQINHVKTNAFIR